VVRRSTIRRKKLLLKKRGINQKNEAQEGGKKGRLSNPSKQMMRLHKMEKYRVNERAQCPIASSPPVNGQRQSQGWRKGLKTCVGQRGNRKGFEGHQKTKGGIYGTKDGAKTHAPSHKPRQKAPAKEHEKVLKKRSWRGKKKIKVDENPTDGKKKNKEILENFSHKDTIKKKQSTGVPVEKKKEKRREGRSAEEDGRTKGLWVDAQVYQPDIKGRRGVSAVGVK